MYKQKENEQVKPNSHKYTIIFIQKNQNLHNTEFGVEIKFASNF